MEINNFEQMISSIKNKQPTNMDYMKVIAFLNKYYKKGQIIYPDAVQRECEMDEVIAIKTLELCKDAGFVARKFVAKCPACCHLDSTMYDSVNDEIPESTNCIHCDTEINVLKNFERVYLVIKTKRS